MIQEPPVWLDESFLASALQGEDDTKGVTSVKFSASPAVAAGNNYTSQLYRVNVQYTIPELDPQVTSLIVKAPVTKGVMIEMSQNCDFFSKEPKIYNKLLPYLSSKFGQEFGPTYYYSNVKNVLVLKDMSREGYVMCDRFKQLDYSHCKCVFETLAKFHASSVACYRDDPDLIKEVGEDFMSKSINIKKEEMEIWLQSCVKTAVEIVSEIKECKSAAEMFLSRLNSADIAESIERVSNPKKEGLNVLNHGDLWTNNVLFKHTDSGDVEDVKFIDFQMSKFASPLVDLLYFMWTSASEDVRESRQQELYNVYLQTLNEKLEELRCPERLSEEEFHQDIKAAADWVIVVICGTLPMMMCDKEDMINLEEVSRDDFTSTQPCEKILKMYNSKHYRSLLPNLMRQFHSWISVYS